MNNLNELKHLLASPKRIAINPHLRPDGDAMGSSLGLWNYLQQKGHSASVVVPTAVPDYLEWMPGAQQAVVGEMQPDEAKRLIAEADIVFCLDYGVLNRSGVLEPWLRASSAVKVHIDHHLDFENFAQFEFRDTAASSTCELIYRFIQTVDPSAIGNITEACATCLYTGVMTDTGSFRFDTATAAVHQTIAALINRGVEVSRVHQNVFNSFTEGRTRFLGHVLSERLRVLPDLHTAYMTISQADMKRYGVHVSDTEGIVNYALGIRGINFGVIMIEHPDQVKLSFRSVGSFSANAFAAQFNGGGHFHAAGGQSQLSLAETETRFLALLQPQAQALDYQPV